MLVQRGEPVDLAFVVGSRDASQYAGGVIVAGTYALTEATEYVEPSHVGTGPSPYGRETIRITAGTLEVLHDYANGHELRFSAELRSVDGRLEMTPRCVVSNDDALPTLGHWAPLEHETTGFLATSATLTIWTPLGNHASVVRVYARVD